MSDARVEAGLRRQLEAWRRRLETGAERVGWKIGLNLPEVQERLRAGDRIIAAAVTPPVPVAPGDLVEVELTGLGNLSLRVA